METQKSLSKDLKQILSIKMVMFKFILLEMSLDSQIANKHQ